MKGSAISVTCMLCDWRRIEFIQQPHGSVSVQVTYERNLINIVSTDNIRVQQEAGIGSARPFSEIDRFGRQAILEAINRALEEQPVLDSNCPVYLEIINGEQISKEKDKIVNKVKNITIFFKKTKELDNLNKLFGLFPKC